jgi:hypothetical protein
VPPDWVLLAANGAVPLGALTAGISALLAVGALLCLAEAAAALRVVVRLSVDSVQVRPGLLPLGGPRIPIPTIRTVRVIDAPAMPWRSRGWWWMPGPARAVLIRSGPTLVLGLTGGRQVLVSVDQPETAAQVLRWIGLPHIS